MLRDRSSAGAGILGYCPEMHASPGSTGLAIRRHLRKLENFVAVRVARDAGLEKIRFVLSLGIRISNWMRALGDDCRTRE